MREEELSNLITEYGKDVFNFCLRLCVTHYEAEELYQETFLKVIELGKEIDRSKNPKSYLLCIATGIYRNQKKKYAIRQRIAPIEVLSEHMSESLAEERYGLPEQEIIQKEVAERVRAEISLLQDKYRIPVLMYYAGNLSCAEIGKALKLPQGTVKNRLFKARKLLKEKLEDLNDENGY